MYVFLSPLMLMIITNCLCTIAHDDPIIRNLKHIVDTALEQETSDELLIEQLSRILEQEEGFRIADRQRRAIYPTGDENERRIFDGSGDVLSDDYENDLPPFYSNMSIVAFTTGSTTTAFSQYRPQPYPSCPCEKGQSGEKGDAGVCPADCGSRYNAYTKDCLGPRINLERLAQSIRQLIIDTKKIAYRNARTTPCVCPTPPPPTTVSAVSNRFTLDYNTYIRLKGDKGDRGDTGTSCSSTCTQSTQTNVRVFATLQQALDASYTYPDHTYVHIVNDYGHLQSVFIRVHGRLIPLRIENENSMIVQEQTLTPTTLSIPKTQCSTTLSCSTLHMFSIGPYIRKKCNQKRTTVGCSKLADYDDLCGLVSQRYRLKGFYRAFMSTSTQWLVNLFSGICVNAKIVNIRDQTLFESVEDIFNQRPAQSDILDAQGSKPQFQYWWHGTLINGTASSETCLDWSRQDSSLSGMASRLPDTVHGLFHHQNAWPCSVGESNMGILCIETNCDRNNYYKH